MQERRLWSAAKLAVRAYARDPSARNAIEVQQAWHRIRQSESLAIWKGMKPRPLDRDTLFPYAKTSTTQVRDDWGSPNGTRRPGS